MFDYIALAVGLGFIIGVFPDWNRNLKAVIAALCGALLAVGLNQVFDYSAIHFAIAGAIVGLIGGVIGVAVRGG